MLPGRLLLGASLVLLAGCGSDKITATGLNGSLSFSYSNGLVGTYSATGALTGEVTTSTWSAGAVNSGAVFVESATPASASTHNFVFLAIPRTTAGNVTIDPNCSANICAEMFFELGAPNTGSALPTQTCLMLSGTLTITEITSPRVRGTFSGTGVCTSSGGQNVNITVSGGAFDVAIVSNLP